jgi:hypothetical protein
MRNYRPLTANAILCGRSWVFIGLFSALGGRLLCACLIGLFLQWYLAENPAMRWLRRGKKQITLEDGREVIVGHISGEITWLSLLPQFDPGKCFKCFSL